jgi:hypothetical protein
MPPLNLYARVHFFFVQFAHETAGAARTRSSLRPLTSEGRMFSGQPRANHAARPRSCVCWGIQWPHPFRNRWPWGRGKRVSSLSTDRNSCVYVPSPSLGWRWGLNHTMRTILIILGLFLSTSAARADKAVASGRPLQLYHAYATNPDCSSAGAVVLRIVQGPAHGRVSVHQAGVFPNFPPSNPRNACNRRRVRGVEATYVSQRGYLGPDFVVLQVLFPAGREVNVSVPINVM